MEQIVFTIDGMRCSGCANRLEAVLGRERGVSRVRARAEAARADIAFNPSAVGQDRLKEIIEAAGFQVVEVVA